MMPDDPTPPVLDEADEPLDEREQAWFAGDLPRVLALSEGALALHPDDAEAVAWVGLAQYLSDQVPAAQRSLQRAFALLDARRAAPGLDHEARRRLTWLQHGVANRLVDALADDPQAGLAAARFVVDALKLDHGPSLRLLAEDLATSDPVKAATSLKRALAVDATDPETHYLMARLLARLGKKPNVLKHLEAAISYGAGLVSVRTLARFEPDFDGFRQDADFCALVDALPADPRVRPVYAALDAGRPLEVPALAKAAVDGVANPLDVLYPWREAVELLLESGQGDAEALGRALDELDARIGRLEEQDQVSHVYQRWCGDEG
jgi:tetratricopeptide (TPR) repeat protein